MTDPMPDQDRAGAMLRDGLQRTLAKLDRNEEKFLDLATDDEVPQTRLRERLREITREREAAGRALAEIGSKLEIGGALLEAGLALLERPQELYRQAGESERRLLNQAFLEKLYSSDDGVVAEVFAEQFDELAHAYRAWTAQNDENGPPEDR